MSLKIGTNSFKSEIESLVWDLDISYTDAIIEWCTRNSYELEYAATLVKRNKDILTELEQESLKLHSIKKTLDSEK